MKTLLLFLILSMFISSNTYSCDYCISIQGVSPIEAGSSGVRYDARYLYLGKMYQDGNEIPNISHEEETYITHQLSLYYNIGGRISASLHLPFVHRFQSGNVEGHNHQTGSDIMSSQLPQHGAGAKPYRNQVDGLSDMAIYGRYSIMMIEGSPLSITVSAGLKLPSGAVDARDDEGELLNPHIQTGTGSTDPLLGFDVYYIKDDYSLSLNVLGCYPTKGAQEYQFGTMINYTINGKYHILEFADVNSLYANFGISGEFHRQESMNGELVANTGGHTTYIYPGIQFLIGQYMSFDLSFHIPVMRQAVGIQLGESYKAMGGVQYLF